MIDKQKLKEYAGAYGVAVDAVAAEKLDRYAELLVQWNEKMNLTAITEPTEIVVKHFVDSLTALPLLPKKEGVSLVDVGTGAGFPALPLAIVRSDLRVTLLDSLNKRLLFLQEVCRELGVEAQTVHSRAEDGGKSPALREQFDVVTARAVAALPILAEYCLPFCKVGGVFLAMKGPESHAEFETAKTAVALLGAKSKAVKSFLLPPAAEPGEEQYERCIYCFEKVKATPPRFPRPSAKIKKEPLR